MYLSHPLKSEVARIFSAAFPGYSGRKYRVETSESVQIPNNYWDGGSREYCVFIDLSTLKRLEIASNHPWFERNNPAQSGAIVKLDNGVAMVTNHIFCGKDMGLTLTVHPANVNPELLPAPVELTEDESIVLSFTASRKASYAGISNYRFHEARRAKGITLERWESAKSALIGRKLLAKNGAITPDGRNAIK